MPEPGSPVARGADLPPSVWARCTRCGQIAHVSDVRCPSCGRSLEVTPPPTTAAVTPAPALTRRAARHAVSAPSPTDAWWNPGDQDADGGGPPEQPRDAPAEPTVVEPTDPVLPLVPALRDDDVAAELPRDPAARLIAELVRGTPPARRPARAAAAVPPVPAPPSPAGPSADDDADRTAAMAAVPDDDHEDVDDVVREVPAASAGGDGPVVEPADDAVHRQRAERTRPPTAAPSWLPERFHAAAAVLPPALRRNGVLAAALATVVLVAATLVAVSLLPGDAPASAAPAASASAVSPTTVAATSITAEASSVQEPEGGVDYGAENTLDGRTETAWNSNGKKDGKGPGMALTYTFATPVDVRSVTLLNGYQKTTTKNGKSTDLFSLNSRVRTLRVVSDTGSWTWQLQDTRAPQTFPQDLGRTTNVRLEVLAVYPGAKYTDLAISEVSFTAVG